MDSVDQTKIAVTMAPEESETPVNQKIATPKKTVKFADPIAEFDTTNVKRNKTAKKKIFKPKQPIHSHDIDFVVDRNRNKDSITTALKNPTSYVAMFGSPEDKILGGVEVVKTSCAVGQLCPDTFKWETNSEVCKFVVPPFFKALVESCRYIEVGPNHPVTQISSIAYQNSHLLINTIEIKKHKSIIQPQITRPAQHGFIYLRNLSVDVKTKDVIPPTASHYQKCEKLFYEAIAKSNVKNLRFGENTYPFCIRVGHLKTQIPDFSILSNFEEIEQLSIMCTKIPSLSKDILALSISRSIGTLKLKVVSTKELLACLLHARSSFISVKNALESKMFVAQDEFKVTELLSRHYGLHHFETNNKTLTIQQYEDHMEALEAMQTKVDSKGGLKIGNLVLVGMADRNMIEQFDSWIKMNVAVSKCINSYSMTLREVEKVVEVEKKLVQQSTREQQLLLDFL